MSDVLIALFFGFGVGGWAFSQLAKHNGNATPASNGMAATGAGFLAAIVIFTVFKFILNM